VGTQSWILSLGLMDSCSISFDINHLFKILLTFKVIELCFFLVEPVLVGTKLKESLESEKKRQKRLNLLNFKNDIIHTSQNQNFTYF